MEPYLKILKNPLDMGRGTQFTHFEISTVRDWYPPGADERITERAEEPEDCEDYAEGADGDVYFGLYGYLPCGGSEHIADRAILEDVFILLERMGCYVRTGIRRNKAGA